jgi:hypothetical protein
MLEKFIKKEDGKQNPTRILSAVRIRKKIFSISSPTKRSRSISNAQNSAAKTPITARTANETIPVFVIILSKLLKLMIDKNLMMLLLVCLLMSNILYYNHS